MASREKKHGGIGPLGVTQMEKRPLREHKESRYRGSRGSPGRARERGFADTDPSPRVTRPDGMRASGPRELTKRKVNAPKIDRSVMVKGVAKNESSIGGSRGGGDGEEELAEPEVRDDKQSFARNHALEVRVMKSSRVDDAGELVGG